MCSFTSSRPRLKFFFLNFLFSYKNKLLENSTFINCALCNIQTPLIDEDAIVAIDKLPNYNFNSNVATNCSQKSAIKNVGTLNPSDSKNPSVKTSEEDFVILETVQNKGNVQTYYIPFTKQKERCNDLFERWLSEMWFAPYDIKEKSQVGSFEAVYVPFYLFNVITETTYSCDIQSTIKEGNLNLC